MTSSPQPDSKDTTYVILAQHEDLKTYTFITDVTTDGGRVAALKKAGDQAGAATYVAVPVSSFVPTKVTPYTGFKLETA